MNYDCRFGNEKLICIYCQKQCTRSVIAFECGPCNVKFFCNDDNTLKRIMMWTHSTSEFFDVKIDLSLSDHKTYIYEKWYAVNDDNLTQLDCVINITPHNFDQKMKTILTYG